MRCCLLTSWLSAGVTVVCLCLLVAGISSAFDHEEHDYPNTYKGPVIGILTQRTWGDMEDILGYTGTYIAASYVRYLEMAGLK